MPRLNVTIISDVVCPWCFIGKRRLERALVQRADLDVAIRWSPYELHPHLPREGIDRDTLMTRKFGGGARGKAVFDRVAAEGEAEGIAFNFDAINTIPNTISAHCVLHWAAGGVESTQDGADSARQNRLAEEMFAALFERGEDLGSHATLTAIAARAGMHADAVLAKLEADIDREEIRQEADDNRGRGVMGVPHFIVDGRYPIPGAQPPDTILHVIDRAVATQSDTM